MKTECINLALLIVVKTFSSRKFNQFEEKKGPNSKENFFAESKNLQTSLKCLLALKIANSQTTLATKFRAKKGTKISLDFTLKQWNNVSNNLNFEAFNTQHSHYFGRHQTYRTSQEIVKQCQSCHRMRTKIEWWEMLQLQCCLRLSRHPMRFRLFAKQHDLIDCYPFWGTLFLSLRSN